MKRIDKLRSMFRYDTEAADAVGVSTQCFHHWVKKGKELPKWTWPDAAAAVGVSIDDFKAGFDDDGNILTEENA